MRINPKRKLVLLVSFALALLLVAQHARERGEPRLSAWFDPSKRPDVVTTTHWGAPVIWEGTFDRQVLQRLYRQKNITVGLAVFATGRAADLYLERFLHSANRHFMVGYRVVFYIIAGGDLQRLPPLVHTPLRTFKVLASAEEGPWTDPHFLRAKKLGEYIVSHIRGEADYLFSMGADHIFQSDVGVETLGAAVAQLHGWWYFKDPKDFPYERESGSAACISSGQGDFFYDGAVLVGTPSQLLDLVEVYQQGVARDRARGLSSTFEQHLNKYFFLHKPTKLLSPEYNWDVGYRPPLQIQFVKLLQLAKRDP